MLQGTGIAQWQAKIPQFAREINHFLAIPGPTVILMTGMIVSVL